MVVFLRTREVYLEQIVSIEYSCTCIDLKWENVIRLRYCSVCIVYLFNPTLIQLACCHDEMSDDLHCV
jgi:hypothetical protein